VRGLALRSLCSLRLESILEYIEQPLQKALRDISAYVRKTGVMGVLKVYYLSPTIVEANRYVETLETMLGDADANVITNVIFVLNELRLAQGGLEASQTTVMALLQRIGEFSEWGLNTVLDLVARYRPQSEEEVFSIMNLLDPVLRTANSGSVLATLKCFFRLTNSMDDLQSAVIGRAKPPLLTLITGGCPEVQYMALRHLDAILRLPSASHIFESEYRQLFVRYNEPPHVKHLKVDLLPAIATPTHARDIAAELNEYVTDVDAELAKRALRALGEIAIRVESVSEEMTQSLVLIMDMQSAYLRSQAAVVLSDVVRIHPRLSDLVLPHLGKYLRHVEDSEARAALVWMLGEFGHNVLEAPYILEQLVDTYEEETSAQIKLQLLTATMKLFMQRPPEVQRMLGRLLRQALNDSTNQDLHDRALLYYRLLSADVNAASAIVCTGPACTAAEQRFAEDKDTELDTKLFAEFNTLAIVFKSPSTQFVQEKYRQVRRASHLCVMSADWFLACWSSESHGRRGAPLPPHEDRACRAIGAAPVAAQSSRRAAIGAGASSAGWLC
jgi:AP-4 complex subunit beta-1